MLPRFQRTASAPFPALTPTPFSVPRRIVAHTGGRESAEDGPRREQGEKPAPPTRTGQSAPILVPKAIEVQREVCVKDVQRRSRRGWPSLWRGWSSGALLALVLPAPLLAYAPSEQVPVLLKVLTFERTLQDDPDDDLRIVVVDQPKDGESDRIAAEVVSELRRYGGQRINGRPIRVDRRTVGELLERSDPEVEVLYLSAGLEGLLPNILDWSRRNGAISFTGSRSLGEKGVAVWLAEDDGKPRILINLVQLRAEGREFDARLLRLATVRR
ncbi:MAG: DUF4154 domain-containing protein [Candidatus Eisenbacteria bacterium]|nr:DUF4154 domain-containing protein [Candidatus Latescibacterota bacterium]MBD3301791.1 DUF4154 domain-containing protein [Candidatus Eisenbacteria bacterium]